MRCDECRHWATEEWLQWDWEANGIGFRQCMAVRERWKIQDAVCDQRSGDEHIEMRKQALKATRAYVQDGSEYHAELITGPDFFCALWAAR